MLSSYIVHEYYIKQVPLKHFYIMDVNGNRNTNELIMAYETIPWNLVIEYICEY